MAGSPDSSNLMYVTKAYEEEVKNKAKRIYSNDEVSLSLENINKQLDDIVKEIDSKLEFVNEKIVGDYGVDAYVQGVHTQIDRVDVAQENLVPDDIKNTHSHPSVMAIKSTRADTKYTTYDFINKSIELNNDTPNLALRGSKVIDPTANMLTFSFNTSLKEYLKIIEFSFTYKQYPDMIMFDADKNISREPTVTITRIISGRFFLIRHDPINHPDEFIIKAIINNSDNTGNIIDKKIIDVHSYKETGDVSYIFDNGPQFDLYFTFDNTNNEHGLKVHIGKIVPYRYIARKTFVNNDDGTLDTNFKKMDYTYGATDAVGSHNIEEAYHSNNLACTFIVDKTRNEISILSDGNNFDNRVLASQDNIKHNSGSLIEEFWVKDIGYFTFIRLKDNDYDTCFVGINNVNNLYDLGRPVDDFIRLSSDEILAKIGNKYYYYDTNSNAILDQQIYSLTNSDITFGQKSMILEYNDTDLILIYTQKDKLCYRIKEKDKETNLYSTNLSMSPEHEFEDFPAEKINNINPVDSELFGFSDATGLYIGANYIGESSNHSFIINANKLVISGISYLFTENSLLTVFNKLNNNTSDLRNKIKKMIKTRLFNFLILENNELFVFDEQRITKAITFEEVENKGWTDKNSILYMKPESNQDEYYLIDNAYLQNVKDVVDTPNGVIIIDKEGLYTVDESKNITCRLFFDNNSEVLTYLPSFDKYGRSGILISIDDKTAAIKKYSIYKNDYVLKEYSGNKLRYEYLDLFTSDYQLYDENIDKYDEELPVIDFHSILYISFVDHLSVLYNTIEDNNISYDEASTYSVIQNPEYNAQKYCISPNKYGFVKYDNILSLDKSESRVSDINAIKKLKIIHKADDTFTYQDAVDTIHEIVRKEYEKFRSDMVYIKGPVTYESNNSEFEPFKHIEYGTYTPNKPQVERIIDTKYGRYACCKYRNTDVLGNGYDVVWISNSALTEEIPNNNVDTKFKWLDLINCNFTNSSLFKIICLDDNRGTTFITNGQYVYKTFARDNDGTYTTPFTDRDKVFICQVDSENLTNITKTKDGEVLAWISVEGNQNIYRYDSVSQQFVQYDTLTTIFEDVVSDVSTIKIINVIKIGNNYHIIGLNHEVDSIYHLKYVIRGEKHLTIDSNGSILPLRGPLDGIQGSNVEFYDFHECILAVVNNNKQSYICKYDSVSDKFIPSIHQLDYNEESIGVMRLVEVKNNDHYDIYGGYKTIEKPYYPALFKLDAINDSIETIVPIIKKDNEIEFFDLYYDKYQKFLNASSTDAYVRYFVQNDTITTLKETNSANRPYLISKPSKIVTQIGEKEEFEYKSYSLAEHTVEGHNDLYLTTVEQNTVPNFICKVGVNNTLSDMITTPSVTKDEYPLTIGSNIIKNYYKIDPSKTIFNLYSSGAQSYPPGSNINMVKLFKRTVKHNNIKIKIDKTVVKEPIRGFKYYKMNLNGNFDEQFDIQEFDKLADYYIDDAIYQLLTPEDYIKPENNFNPDWVNKDNPEGVLLFTCVDPQFTECTSDDFVENINPETSALYPYLFKPNTDLVYYELNTEEYVFNFDKSNFRFMDDKVFIRVPASTGREVYETVDQTTELAPRSDTEYYTESGGVYSKVVTDPFDAWAADTVYYTKRTVYDNNVGDKPYNEHELAYSCEDTSLFMQNMHSNDIINHLLPITYDKVISTKFFKLGIETRAYSTGKHVLSIKRISDDLKYVNEEYLNYIIDEGRDEPLIEVNETSKYVFVTLRDTQKNIFNTYIIDGETLKWSETDVSSRKDYHYITEFENGNIYGISLDTSVNGTMYVYKHGLNDTKAFGDSLSIDVGGAMIVNAFKHTRDDGRIELLIFCFGTKYSIYRLYDDALEPYDDVDLQYLLYDTNFTLLGDKFINYSRNVIYDLKTKELTYFANPTELDIGDDVEAICINDESYPGINKEKFVLINKTKEHSRIYDFSEISNDPYGLYDNEKNIYTLQQATIDNNGENILMSEQLPIVSDDDELYYTFAKANSENLKPIYDKKYIVYGQNNEMKYKDVNFDRLYNTSLGLFGIRGLEICLNEIYSNNNGFKYLTTLPSWTGKTDVTPIIQEVGEDVYLCYKYIYKFNKNTYTFEKILNFADNETVNIQTFNRIDEDLVIDRYYTKMFVTENNDMYYFVDVDGIHNVYKYNKITKTMDLYYELSDYMTVIRETSLGVIILTHDFSLYNITRKEKITLPPSVDSHIIIKIYDFVEIVCEHSYLYMTVLIDGPTFCQLKYDYETKELSIISSFLYNNRIMLKKAIDSEGNSIQYALLCLFDETKLTHEFNTLSASDSGPVSTGNIIFVAFDSITGQILPEYHYQISVSKSDPTLNIINYRVYPVKKQDGNYEFAILDNLCNKLAFVSYNPFDNETPCKETTFTDSIPYITGIMNYNGIYIYNCKDKIILNGFDIKEVKKEVEEDNTIKHIGYLYTFIGRNTKQWNNELTDETNTLRDKYIRKVFGLYNETSNFKETFIDNNNDYESDVDLVHSRRMSLVEFYKKYYVTHWESNKSDHLFKRRDDIMNDLYMSSSDTLKPAENGGSIFDDEQFEIELVIFGSPIESAEEEKINSIRLSNSWYLKKLNKHVSYFPYYPFDDM